MTPAALTKAESLKRYVTYSGSPQREFVLAVTLGEAYELLDYLVEIHPASALLKQDVAEAKVSSNPWAVLANFQLLGFEITRADFLH